MEVWFTYLLVGTAFLFLVISYKFQKPVLGIISGVLFLFLAVAFYLNNVNVPIGSTITSNTFNGNTTYYNLSTSYIDPKANSGISNFVLGILFTIISGWIMFESFARVAHYQKPEFKEYGDKQSKEE